MNTCPASRARVSAAMRSRTAATWLAMVLPRACWPLDTRAYRATWASGMISSPPYRFVGDPVLVPRRPPEWLKTPARDRHQLLVGLDQTLGAEPGCLERNLGGQWTGFRAPGHQRLLRQTPPLWAANAGSTGRRQNPLGSGDEAAQEALSVARCRSARRR